MKETILLTGSNGFLGGHLKQQLSSENLLFPNRDELELLNSTAVKKYLEQHSPTTIIHAAWAGASRSYTSSQELAFLHNVKAFSHLFHQIGSCTKRFIQIGSGAEYGRPLAKSKIKESDLGKIIPTDEYGLAKFLCSMQMKNSGISTVSLHFFGVFGPNEDYKTRFISHAIVSSLLNLPIVINQDVYFDYLYVHDAVRIIKQFLFKKPSYSNYNVGTGLPIKLSELAEIIKMLTKNPYPIFIKKAELNHEYTANTDRLHDFLTEDFRFTPIEQALEELIFWYKKNISALTLELQQKIPENAK